MNNTMRNIDNIMSKKRMSKIAKKRLDRDLDAIYKRLNKNEYEISGITENVFDVADTTKRHYEQIKTYAEIGKTWSQILQHLNIHKYKEILDILPGHSPKIELALFYLNYKGTVIALNKNSDSLVQLTKFMELFKPRFAIASYTHDLFSPLTKQFPLVIGNHIIDDMICDYFAKKFNISSEKIYESELEFISIWNKILKSEKNNRNEIVQKIESVFINLISPNGYLCLAQYKSYIERMLDVDRAYSFSKKVFNEVVKNLCKNGFVEIDFSNYITSKKHSYFRQEDTAILKRIKA